MKSVQIRSFFWSVFIRIQTEYGDVLRIFPYSVQMQENTDQKKLCIWTLSAQSIEKHLGARLRIVTNRLNHLSSKYTL